MPIIKYICLSHDKLQVIDERSFPFVSLYVNSESSSPLGEKEEFVACSPLNEAIGHCV